MPRALAAAVQPPEDGTARPDVQWAEGEKPGSVRDKKDLDLERTGISPASQPSPETPEDLAQLSVGEVVRPPIPDTPEPAADRDHHS
jgi:hypothetical protein